MFFDTLLTRLTPPEVEAVLAHELGHFRLRHVVKRIVWIFAASLAFLWLLDFVMHQEWFYAGLNVEARSTAIALVLFFLVVPSFTFLLQPLLLELLAQARVRGRPATPRRTPRPATSSPRWSSSTRTTPRR